MVFWQPNGSSVPILLGLIGYKLENLRSSARSHSQGPDARTMKWAVTESTFALRFSSRLDPLRFRAVGMRLLEGR